MTNRLSCPLDPISESHLKSLGKMAKKLGNRKMAGYPVHKRLFSTSVESYMVLNHLSLLFKVHP